MEKQIWSITPENVPYLRKHCSKCASETFENSGCFRVNANGRKLDIWLIYRCTACKATWNLTVMERTDPRNVERALYDRFLANDADLAMQYGLDIAFLKRNDAEMDRDSLRLRISGNEPLGPGEYALTLEPTIPLDVPAGRVIAQGLEISLSAVKRMFDTGALQADWELRKAKLTKPLTLHLTVKAEDSL